MVVIQFFENKSLVLSQLVKDIPSVDENIKIKGRKGKVLSVKHIDEKLIHVNVEFEKFEKLVKNQAIAKETNKKKR